jgi:cell division GTPase FtsZ
MLELDESAEQGVIVRVIGAGAFGLRVVGNMVGRIHNVECFGVVQKDSAGPDNLPLVSLSRCSDQDHHDSAPLLEKLGTPDLVFIVANLDEDNGMLKDICTALHNGNIPTFLVIPESACNMERKTGSAGLECMEKVTLDGVLILSKTSMAPPYPPYWNVQDTLSLQDDLFQLAIRQIVELMTTSNMMGMDYHDVMVTICGGMMQFGAGIAYGDEGAFRAAEKASACLINQRIELQTISSMLNSVYGSSNIMNMDDYNSVSKFIHSQINEECNYRIGVINDDSLGDSLLVSFIAVRRPSEEAVFPPWVKLYDKYYRTRHSEQSAPDTRKFNDDEEYEVPSWLRKAP